MQNLNLDIQIEVLAFISITALLISDGLVTFY